MTNMYTYTYYSTLMFIDKVGKTLPVCKRCKEYKGHLYTRKWLEDIQHLKQDFLLITETIRVTNACYKFTYIINKAVQYLYWLSAGGIF